MSKNTVGLEDFFNFFKVYCLHTPDLCTLYINPYFYYFSVCQYMNYTYNTDSLLSLIDRLLPLIICNCQNRFIKIIHYNHYLIVNKKVCLWRIWMSSSGILLEKSKGAFADQLSQACDIFIQIFLLYRFRI